MPPPLLFLSFFDESMTAGEAWPRMDAIVCFRRCKDDNYCVVGGCSRGIQYQHHGDAAVHLTVLTARFDSDRSRLDASCKGVTPQRSDDG